jgi:hypothetical protein
MTKINDAIRAAEWKHQGVKTPQGEIRAPKRSSAANPPRRRVTAPPQSHPGL